jgi:hypothetical protein
MGERTSITPTTGVKQGHRHPSPHAGFGRGTQASTPQQASRAPETYSNLGRNYSGTFPHCLWPASPPEGLRSGQISGVSSLATVDGGGEGESMAMIEVLFDLYLTGLSWPLHIGGQVSRNRSGLIHITTSVYNMNSYFNYDHTWA